MRTAAAWGIMLVLLLAGWTNAPAQMGFGGRGGPQLRTPEARDGMLRVLNERVVNGRLQSLSYAENLTVLYYSFTGISARNLEGLEASLKEVAPILKLNIYFNRQGVLP
jgi:hypothetical protein